MADDQPSNLVALAPPAPLPAPPTLAQSARIALMVNWRTTGVSFIAAVVLAAADLPQLVPYKLSLTQLSAAIAILGGARARDAGVTQP